MTPEIERFLDLATRPLEPIPNEREEAKGELMSRIGHGGVPYEMLDLAKPVARLAEAKPPKSGLRRALLLSAAVLLIAATATATALLAWEIFLMSQAAMMSVRGRFGGSFVNQDDYLPVLNHVRSVAPDLPLGLHPEAGGSGETSAALARNPGDLAMRQEHVLRRLRERSPWDGLTSEDRETISRLDPDNALWPLIQITPALTKATGTSSVSWAGRSTIATVTSEPDFDEALRLFSEAAAKPAYFDRSESLRRRQLDAFPPPRSLSESMVATGFTGLASPPFGFYSGSLHSLADIHTSRRVAAGDKEGLAKFYREWKQLSTHVVGSPDPGAIEYNDIMRQLAGMGRSLADALDRLGMTVEKAGVDEQMKVLEQLTINPVSLRKDFQETAGLRLRSEDRLPKDLTVEEALPSRRVEFLFFDRILGSAFSCLALVFAGLVAFETCRRSRIVKGMARGLMPLFRKEDHGWIAMLGLALPWLWWWAISRMSPLGWRDGDLDEPWAAMTAPIQSVAGLIFAAVMLLQTARWRWSVRGGFLGLGVSMPWIGWGVAALTALAIPAAGSLRYFDSLDSQETAAFMLGVSGMAACGLLWLLWQGVMTLFTPRGSALRPNLTMRAALPWALTSIATLLASVAVSTMLERHWFANDPLFPSWTSKTHVNALRERVAKDAQEASRDL